MQKSIFFFYGKSARFFNKFGIPIIDHFFGKRRRKPLFYPFFSTFSLKSKPNSPKPKKESRICLFFSTRRAPLFQTFGKPRRNPINPVFLTPFLFKSKPNSPKPKIQCLICLLFSYAQRRFLEISKGCRIPLVFEKEHLLFLLFSVLQRRLFQKNTALLACFLPMYSAAFSSKHPFFQPVIVRESSIRSSSRNYF